MKLLRVLLSLAISGTGIVLLAWLIGTMIAVEPTLDKAPVGPAQPVSLAASQTCTRVQEHESNVMSAIAAGQVCSTDDQCILESYGCPFGCATAINASYRLDIRQAVNAYAEYLELEGCQRCLYSCVARSLTPVCRQGKCSIRRFEPLEPPPN